MFKITNHTDAYQQIYVTEIIIITGFDISLQFN